MTASSAAPSVPASTGRGVRVARAVLLVVGVALIGLGGYVLTDTVAPTRYGGLLVWLIGSVIVHDAVLAPLVVGVSLVVRRAGRRVRPAVLAIVQTTVIVGAVLSIVVVPEIIAKAKGTKNDTVLPFDYGARLGLLWLVLALLAAATIAVYLAATRRQKVRPEADQV
jgi:hypothetical protein